MHLVAISGADLTGESRMAEREDTMLKVGDRVRYPPNHYQGRIVRDPGDKCGVIVAWFPSLRYPDGRPGGYYSRDSLEKVADPE